MFMKDFEPYRYSGEQPLTKVAAIGWLSRDHSYSQGKCPNGFIEKLINCWGNYKTFKYYGYHHCDFCSTCPAEEILNGIKAPLGSREIWIPTSEKYSFYAAPELIIHYCLTHDYLPPQEFIDAVMQLDISSYSYKEISNKLKKISFKLYKLYHFERIVLPKIQQAKSEEEEREIAWSAKEKMASEKARMAFFDKLFFWRK